MPEMSPGAALRALQNAQAVLKKARKSFPIVRSGQGDPQKTAAQAWASLANAHQVLSAIPWASTNDEVLTRAIALQRYATATLVRIRRLARNETDVSDDLDDDSE